MVAEDSAAFARNSQRLIARVRAASGTGTTNILAISGGGAGAAFGAGALRGLTLSGKRPEFHVVTGVSAGALLAPFAFLGPAWDDELAESFSGKESVGLLKFSLSGLLFGKSIYRGNALEHLVRHYADQRMLDAVAAEARKGRLLLVATTDLDSERTVVWDLGAIAMHGGAAALPLFRDVLIASASIPGIFPPVMIRVSASGTVLEEMHVDGSTTASVFIAPEIASIYPERLQDLQGAHIFVLSNSQYGSRTESTPPKTRAIIRRGVQAALHSGTRGAIWSIYSLAERNKMVFSVTSIPDDYPFDGLLDLRPERMSALFEFAQKCAAAEHLWTSPEGLIQRSSRAMMTLPDTPIDCPASN